METTVDMAFIESLLDLREQGVTEDAAPFVIDNDGKADWAIVTIMDEIAERDRILAIADERIRLLQEQKRELIERTQRKTQYLSDHLQAYFATVKPSSETKTTTKYKLLSGSLVLKRQQPEYVRDEQAMVDWAEKSASKYVRIEKRINWAELKKATVRDGERLCYAETGEVIPGVVAKARPDQFEVVTA